MASPTTPRSGKWRRGWASPRPMRWSIPSDRLGAGARAILAESVVLEPPLRAGGEDGGPARRLAGGAREGSGRAGSGHHDEGGAAGGDGARGHPPVRPHLHHHAREQGGVRRSGIRRLRRTSTPISMPATSSRVTTPPATRASRTGSRSRAETISASPTTARGIACPTATRRTAPEDPVPAGRVPVHERDESQPQDIARTCSPR